MDINVGTRENVKDYLKVLRRIGKVKGFSPSSYEGMNEKHSFCLDGRSNDIDFMIYDLEQVATVQMESAGESRKDIDKIIEEA